MDNNDTLQARAGADATCKLCTAATGRPGQAQCEGRCLASKVRGTMQQQFTGATIADSWQLAGSFVAGAPKSVTRHVCTRHWWGRTLGKS